MPWVVHSPVAEEAGLFFSKEKSYHQPLPVPVYLTSLSLSPGSFLLLSLQSANQKEAFPPRSPVYPPYY